MQNSSKILIVDSCILFDLVDLDIVNEYFSMDYTYYTTGYVLDEIIVEEQAKNIQKFIKNKQLIIDNLGSFDLVMLLFDEHRSLSLADCSLLELALRKGGTIISSDKSLRNASKLKNIEVNGLLWAIKRLVTEGIMPINKGIESLNKYPKINTRAPIKKIKTIKQFFKNLKNNSYGTI